MFVCIGITQKCGSSFRKGKLWGSVYNDIAENFPLANQGARISHVMRIDRGSGKYNVFFFNFISIYVSILGVKY